jgi:tRNA 2-selenouridine synthase
MASMWDSECVQVDSGTAARVRLLKDKYAHFLADPASLGKRLDRLVQLHGRTVIDGWKEMAQRGDWDALVQDLLERHYDPAYTRAIVSHYPGLARAPKVAIAAVADESFEAAARALLQEPLAQPV